MMLDETRLSAFYFGEEAVLLKPKRQREVAFYGHFP